MNDNTLIPTNGSGNLPDSELRRQELLGGLANISHSIDEAGGVASGLPFIGISSEGIWCYGQDRTDVQPGSHWAVDVRSLKHGFIAWPPATVKERKPLGERMVPASMPLPRQTELPDVGAPYQLQFSFELLCMDGEDAGVMALYKNGSYGAKVIVQTLVEEIRKQAKRDQTKLCPVVKLEIRSYVHKEWKKTIYNPVLEITRWITFEDYDSSAEPQQPAAVAPPQPAPQPQPVRRRQAAAPQPEPPPPPPPPQPTPLPTGRRRPVRSQPTA